MHFNPPPVLSYHCTPSKLLIFPESVQLPATALFPSVDTEARCRLSDVNEITFLLQSSCRVLSFNATENTFYLCTDINMSLGHK